MKFKLFLIIFQFISYGLFSQTIKGKLIDDNNSPIEYAEIIIFYNTTPVKSELSNSLGEFNVAVEMKSKYKVLIRYLGVTILDQEITIDSIVDLGIIQFDNSNQLREVVVASKKKLIEKKSDRLIYNVQSSVFSSGISGDELLKNIPRIDPTSDGFKIIGKNNVLVMVNDRLLNISGEDLKNYLKTIRSENIDKIEIITSPSAKYDASGNSGLINIRLKKNTNLGFDGNVSSNFTQRREASYSNSINLNYSTQKVIMEYSIFSGIENRNSNHTNNYFFSTETRKSFEDTKRENKGLSHNFNIHYQLTKMINTGLNFNYGDWRNDSYRSSKVLFVDASNVIYKSQNLPANTLSHYKGITLSPYFDVKLDTIGSKLKFYYNLNTNERNSTSILNNENYSNNFEIIQSYSQNKNDVDNTFNVSAVGIDLETSISQTKIEFGTKYTYFRNNNDIKFYDSTSGINIIDTTISNFFKYYEKLFATYINVSEKISEKIFLTAGLRYEYTDIEGYLVTQNTINKNFYGNLFPNVSISYDYNDNNSYSISYNRRISRPGLYDLNPFRIYRDANNYEIGNPQLLPTITDNIEVGYVYKGNLSFLLYGSKINDNWAYIVSSDNGNNTIVTQPKNVLTTYDLGSEIGYNWKISKKINNYSSYTISFQRSNSSDIALSDDELKGIRSTISSNTTFTWSKEKANKLFINMFYNTPGVEEMYISKNTFIVRIGTSLSYLSKKLIINAYLTDPFNTTIARNTVNYESFQFTNRIFNDNRSFSLSITYKFGNNKSKNSDRKVDNSEKDRLLKDK